MKYLSDLNEKTLNDAILAHLGGETLETNKGWNVFFRFDPLNQFLGLANSDSPNGRYVAICNVELKYDDKFNYIGFTTGVNLKNYAILWDADENEKLIEI